MIERESDRRWLAVACLTWGLLGISQQPERGNEAGDNEHRADKPGRHPVRHPGYARLLLFGE